MTATSGFVADMTAIYTECNTLMTEFQAQAEITMTLDIDSF